MLDLKATIGFDDIENKHYVMHQDLTGKILKHYYEELDKILIENMPEDIFMNLHSKVTSEYIRRSIAKDKDGN